MALRTLRSSIFGKLSGRWGKSFVDLEKLSEVVVSIVCGGFLACSSSSSCLKKLNFFKQ